MTSKTISEYTTVTIIWLTNVFIVTFSQVSEKLRLFELLNQQYHPFFCVSHYDNRTFKLYEEKKNEWLLEVFRITYDWKSGYESITGRIVRKSNSGKCILKLIWMKKDCEICSEKKVSGTKKILFSRLSRNSDEYIRSSQLEI